MKSAARKILEDFGFRGYSPDFLKGLQKLIQLQTGNYLRLIKQSETELVYEVCTDIQCTKIIGRFYLGGWSAYFSKFEDGKFLNKNPSPKIQNLVEIWKRKVNV